MTDTKAKKAKKSTPSKPKSTAKAKRTIQITIPANPDEIAERVREVLMEVMYGSGSDSVRVAAAKVLMDKLTKQNSADGDEEARRTDGEERADALSEALELLNSFADAKSSGADCSGKVD